MASLKTALSIIDKIQQIDYDNMTLEEILQVERRNRDARDMAAHLVGGPSTELVFTSEQAQSVIYGLRSATNHTAHDIHQNEVTNVTISQSVNQIAPTPTPSMSIEDMFQRFRSAKDTKSQKYCLARIQRLYEMVNVAGLTPQDDFLCLIEYASAKKIFDWIKTRPNSGSRTQGKLLTYFKQLVNYAILVNRSLYDTHILGDFPQKPKLKKSEQVPHQPFSTDELLKIFSPDFSTFDENPDLFWVCVIALFVGARQNAAYTLMYRDIKQVNGRWCMEFIEDHKIKKLKNLASERIVPIPPNMLELGFVNRVEERKKRFGASDDDFIFASCQTKSGNYNGHITRDFCKHLIKIGVKKTGADGRNCRDGKDLHSFRNTASLEMQKCNVPGSMIDRIIGWEGGTTREAHYSKFSLSDIAEAMTLYNYDDIMPELRYWAERLRGK